MFLLDTDHFTFLLKPKEPESSRLRRRMDAYPPESFFVSIVTCHEQLMGWNSFLRENERRRSASGVVRSFDMLRGLLASYAVYNVLPFDSAASAEFARLRGLNTVGTADRRIAAIALARGFVVLTRNTKDFERVPGLRVEDWTRTLDDA